MSISQGYVDRYLHVRCLSEVAERSLFIVITQERTQDIRAATILKLAAAIQRKRMPWEFLCLQLKVLLGNNT